MDGDTLEMAYRTPSNHAHTTTESVMWNVSGERCTRGRLALSQQLGWGYVIGTSGSGDCAQVETPGGEGTEPRDWLEHHCDGDRLEPRSLYLDQLDRRLSRAQVADAPDATTGPGATEATAQAWLALGIGLALMALAVTAGALLLRRRRQ